MKQFATISWTAGDVQSLRGDLTDEQAEAFLSRNEKHLRDRLIEIGWEVMEHLLVEDADLPPEPTDEDDEV
jgi:hypothetical protein